MRVVGVMRPVQPYVRGWDAATDDDAQAAYLAGWAADAEQRRAHRHAVRATLLALAVYVAGLLLAAVVLTVVAVAWASTGDNRLGAVFAGLIAAITVAYAYLTREL